LKVHAVEKIGEGRVEAAKSLGETADQFEFRGHAPPGIFDLDL